MPIMFKIVQNQFGFDAIIRRSFVMQSEREEFPEAGVGDVRKEMAKPRMAQSARHAISQNRRLNQPMRSKLDAPPKISFDLDGLVARNKSFQTGATIFSQGDVAATLMYIKRGRVKLSVISKTDKEAIVAILGPGEFFGETCLGSREIRLRTATAIAPTALQVIERKEMIRALHADHDLSYSFLSYLLSRNIRLEEDLLDQVSHCSERRLARVLLLIAGKGDRRKRQRFAGISQGTLASMIGTTRPRVSFFMNKFKTLGFIKYRGPLDAHGGIYIDTARLAKVLRK
jgi:CRP/FNR family transcriptional regulator, cyclic AMP receptor protein